MGDGERRAMRACLALLLNSGTSRNESGKHTAYWSSSLEDASKSQHPIGLASLGSYQKTTLPDHRMCSVHTHTLARTHAHTHILLHSERVSSPWVPGLCEHIAKEGSEYAGPGSFCGHTYNREFSHPLSCHPLGCQASWQA